MPDIVCPSRQSSIRRVRLGRLLALALPLLLTACQDIVPLIPSGATQTITVSAQGELSMSYTGRFYYPYEEFIQTSRLITEFLAKSGKGSTSDALIGEPYRATAERELAMQLRRDFPEIKLDNLGGGYFDLSLPATTTIPKNSLSSTLLLGTASEHAMVVEISADTSLQKRMNEFLPEGFEPVLKLLNALWKTIYMVISWSERKGLSIIITLIACEKSAMDIPNMSG